MSSEQSEAEKKFWESPELIDTLLSFLDLESTLHLAKAHEVTRNILESSHCLEQTDPEKLSFQHAAI